VLTAVDLNGGTVKWSVPLGRIPWLSSPDADQWGSVNLGGAAITASGLVFIAATWDHRLRALDRENGHELWSAPLPVGGYALPMTYEAGGRQYVVISAGGHDRLDPVLGDYVIAYALPAANAPTPAALRYRAVGNWAGEIRSGDDRHVTTLRLTEVGDSLTGTIEFTKPASTGSVGGRQVGDTVWLTIPFHSSEAHCDGTVMARGELANGGQLLDGGVSFSGPCSTGTPPDSGTFGLWRK
jgi:outer membrane protein assembly factor BamB